jgi:hypothetical protein
MSEHKNIQKGMGRPRSKNSSVFFGWSDGLAAGATTAVAKPFDNGNFLLAQCLLCFGILWLSNFTRYQACVELLVFAADTHPLVNMRI